MNDDFADPETIRRILSEYRAVAVVGLSDKPDRPSYGVAGYLQSQGYKIIPVNPRLAGVLGEKAYPDLLSVPFEIEVVDIFRRSEDVPPVVEAAIEKEVKAVWMQEGVVNPEAAEKAKAAGILVVMNRCMLKEHGRLGLQDSGSMSRSGRWNDEAAGGG
jgi:predicted CoA-binding protein